MGLNYNYLWEDALRKFPGIFQTHENRDGTGKVLLPNEVILKGLESIRAMPREDRTLPLVEFLEELHAGYTHNRLAGQGEGRIKFATPTFDRILARLEDIMTHQGLRPASGAERL